MTQGVLRAFGINLNSVADAAVFTGLPLSLIVDKVEIFGWSGTPAALLAMTIRDAAAGAGNSLVGAIAALNTPITSTALAAQLIPLAAALGAVRVVTTGKIYARVGTANGSALTANLNIYWHTP